MSEKLSISLPNEIYSSLDRLKEFYGATTNSNIIALALESLNWMMERQKEENVIVAMTNDNNTIYVSSPPPNKIVLNKQALKNIIRAAAQETSDETSQETV